MPTAFSEVTDLSTLFNYSGLSVLLAMCSQQRTFQVDLLTSFSLKRFHIMSSTIKECKKWKEHDQIGKMTKFEGPDI